MTRRVTDHRDLMFPVRTVGVYAELCEGVEASRRRIPGKKAIVDCTNDRVISIVSDDYQVVTNREAVDFAFQCCEAAFPEVPRESWEVNSADAPLTRGHCHIDLTHNSAKLQFDLVTASQRPDTYGPFVRVTNSYNRTRALGFEIGFMRKVCRNGMILPRSSVRFTYDHNTRRIAERIRFRTAQRDFRELRGKFLEFLAPMRECRMPMDFFRPIALLALRIRLPENPSKRMEKEWAEVNTRLESLSQMYVREVGENAYALLNVISDIASRPIEAGIQRRARYKLQRLAGAWLVEFSSQCKKPAFQLPRYLGELERASIRSWYDLNAIRPAWQRAA